ncbi:hypothetical protein M409DRAFT_66474 [Zasmidium cellare ATCC 36951]|uniref:RTA1 like protein n=1 Tax=Zasmidium cellare ATCC 36951 TaxID=1080233 RepID=A0A6A6CIC9_ZASCE|nr:uncharacterized protein M409DRAFT_66474 [Zasmidium cellare ATCC 36951]KAF2166974.1 hypothetical protein M409DRAFT_66474 [Zasmidium cellare ATCC 36951]
MSLPTSEDGTPPELFEYHPNGIAACIFIAGFGLGTIAHLVEMLWLRTWYFIPFLIGCIMETFSYYGRYWLSHVPQNFKAYVLYLLLNLPAPIFLAATMYMLIRRIIESLEANELSPLRPSLMSKLFVAGDIICFAVQMAGIGLSVTTSASLQRTGGVVVVIGLVFQVLVFLVFVILVWKFFSRCKEQVGSDTIAWKRYIIALLAASGLIVLRNLVQGIQHAAGKESYVATHEAFAYVFDAVPMLGVVGVFAVFHPGRLQRSVRGGIELSNGLRDDCRWIAGSYV